MNVIMKPGSPKLWGISCLIKDFLDSLEALCSNELAYVL